MKEQIKGWIARDNNLVRSTVFHEEPPAEEQYDGGEKNSFVWVSQGSEISLKRTHGLKPGDCVKAVLTVERGK